MLFVRGWPVTVVPEVEWKETEHPVPEGSFKTLLLVGEDPQPLKKFPSRKPWIPRGRTGAEAQAEAQVRRVPDLVLVDRSPEGRATAQGRRGGCCRKSDGVALSGDHSRAPEVLERTRQNLRLRPPGDGPRCFGSCGKPESSSRRSGARKRFSRRVLSDATFFRRSLSRARRVRRRRPRDGRSAFLDVNPAFERQTGLEQALLGHPLEVLADWHGKKRWIGSFREIGRKRPIAAALFR